MEVQRGNYSRSLARDRMATVVHLLVRGAGEFADVNKRVYGVSTAKCAFSFHGRIDCLLGPRYAGDV